MRRKSLGPASRPGESEEMPSTASLQAALQKCHTMPTRSPLLARASDPSALATAWPATERHSSPTAAHLASKPHMTHIKNCLLYTSQSPRDS